jgi:hypothetical protein
MKEKGIAGCGRRDLRRGHGRKYHNWVAFVKGKLAKIPRRVLGVKSPNCPDGLRILFIASRALHFSDFDRVVHDVPDAGFDS